jgi:hypothetical protein
MIDVKQLNRSDQQIWDDYVNTSTKTTPYHRFAWGKAVERSYGFETLYVGAFHENKLIGVMPLIRMGMPFRQKSLVSLPYCDGAGAVADTQEALSALIAKSLLSCVMQIQRLSNLKHWLMVKK